MAQQHLVWFLMSGHARFECRMAGRMIRHEPVAGSLTICPAGFDCVADADRGVVSFVVAIDRGQFALATAEDSIPEARLIERFAGRDPVLLDLARAMALESAGEYPNGPLFWNELASGFIGRLVARHSSEVERPARGALSKDMLTRLRDYVVGHLDGPIAIATLASMAGRSPFHFSRVFARSVGISPHRYVVHLRLRRAIELLREQRSGLAEVAARTGFADQSHLSRWVRRVYGVSLTQLVRHRQNSTNLHDQLLTVP
jgi:AraC family transcriptional regulator